jgi:hypothetical protein
MFLPDAGKKTEGKYRDFPPINKQGFFRRQRKSKEFFLEDFCVIYPSYRIHNFLYHEDLLGSNRYGSCHKVCFDKTFANAVLGR